MDNIDTRVERIFQELKEKGLIDRDTKLVVKKKVGNFKASAVRNVICYNPEFSAYLNNDAIRFTLLHEMGHKKSGVHNQITYVILSIVILVAWIGVMVAFNLKFFLNSAKYIYTPEYWLFMINLVLSSLGVFFLLLVAGRCVRPKLFLDEFSADLWAAKKLKNVLRVERPSDFLRKLFDGGEEYLKSKESNKKGFGTCLYEAIELIIDPHPSNEERIENIKKNVEGGPRNA